MIEYNPVTPEILAQLKEISGKKVTIGEDINPDYTHDAMPIYGIGMPEVTIDVTSTEEIAAIMKLCNENHIPVTVRGAGTGLAGGCTPVQQGVVLCTMRMNKILGYDEENMNVTVQPGVLLGDLHKDALAHNMFYPPDPGEKLATLGGNVSTNAGGMRAVKYGSTRNYAQAMTVVLPTGEIVQLQPAEPDDWLRRHAGYHYGNHPEAHCTSQMPHHPHGSFCGPGRCHRQCTFHQTFRPGSSDPGILRKRNPDFF